MELENDIEEQKFESLMQDKRHKQLMSAITKSNNNEAVAKAIEKNAASLDAVVSQLKNLNINVEQPEVNVAAPNINLNQDKVISEIGFLRKDIQDLTQAVSDQNGYLIEMCKLKQWVHKIVPKNGRIDEVVSTPKLLKN